ncbi:MAG: NADH-quinone oxidoreductase subunit C [Bacteroidota bacterium]|nr:NADH-quinone oxidoreductase subunit C [Bacteroidota bacterium]MDP4205437.1 NADH-quinone oxidoreductase subunit C [Bacteroidota bacterium]
MFKVDQDLVARVSEKLTTQFGEAILSAEIADDMPVYTVKREIITALLKFLYEDESLQFRFLTDLCGIQYPEAELPFGVIYHLHSFTQNLRIRVKSFAPADDPVFPTATTVFAAANWMERETFDFFGIIFEGHPNLKRILNMEDMDYFPMRKEYPLEDDTREDKDDKMFGR